MIQAAARYLAEIQMELQPRWITFVGPSGTGKTTLARAMWRIIKKRFLLFPPGYGINLGHSAYLVRWLSLVGDMKKGDFSHVENLCEMETKWDGQRGLTNHFALIDDIGQIEDAQKSYLIGALGRIADARMRSWTIWVSNLSIDQLGILDPRVASRMIRDGNEIVENNCLDFNLR